MFLLSQILFFSSYCLIFLIWHSILSLIQSKLIFPASSLPISWYMVFHFKLIYWVLFNFFSFFSSLYLSIHALLLIHLHYSPHFWPALGISSISECSATMLLLGFHHQASPLSFLNSFVLTPCMEVGSFCYW